MLLDPFSRPYCRSVRHDALHWIKGVFTTALSIRHAHVKQPVEVPAIRNEFAAWLDIGKTRPDLVVRFGYAPPMPISRRRPVSDVMSPGVGKIFGRLSLVER
jgi:hypothetical protein